VRPHIKRDDAGWRVPATGTRSRVIYGLLKYGVTDPREIRRLMGEAGIQCANVLAMIIKITNPEKSNAQNNASMRRKRAQIEGRGMTTRITFRTKVGKVERRSRIARAWKNPDGTVSNEMEDLGWFMFLEGSKEGLFIGDEPSTTVEAGQQARVTIDLE